MNLPGYCESRDAYYSGRGVPCLYDSRGRVMPQSTFVRGGDEIKAARTVRRAPKAREIGCCTFLPADLKHWGHFLTEGSSRLWAVGGVKGRVIFSTAGVSDRVIRVIKMSRLSRKILPMLREASGPAVISRVRMPLPSFENRWSCHPIHAGFFQEVASQLGPFKRCQDPVYFSRSKLPRGLRRVVGEREIEAHLRSLGVRIFHPQRESVEEQIRAVNEHDIVIGCRGSAMHNVIFRVSNRPMRVIMFCSSRVDPKGRNNYAMINGLCGIRATYAPNALGFVSCGKKRGSFADNVAKMDIIRCVVDESL